MLVFDRHNPYHLLFWEESDEQIKAIESDLLHLENNPHDMTCIQRLFRNAHSLKGSSATMALSEIAEITHDMETTFDNARKGNQTLRVEQFNALLKQLDAIKLLHQKLMFMSEGQSSSCDEGSWIRVTFTSGTDFLAIKAFQILRALSAHCEVIETIPENSESVEEDALFEGCFVINCDKALKRDVVEAALMPITDIQTFELSIDPFLGHQLPEPSIISTGHDPAREIESDVSLDVKGNQGLETDSESSYLKIPSQTIDQLIHLVTELTMEHNTLASIGKQWLDKESKGALPRKLQSRLEHSEQLLKSIQHIALSARMLPMSTLYLELPRMVRDLSNQLNKSVKLTLEGEYHKVDKRILLALHDPLTHLLRNAIDHGIEYPEIREALGKHPVGQLHLSAAQGDNSLIITLSDDGRGIDVREIQTSALSKGLVSLEECDFFSQEDWFNLLFESGFSTKSQANQVSGRGVGLDVVRANLSAIQGTIQIFSEPSIGTSFVMRLPISLALSKTLIVSHKNYLVGIPITLIQGIFAVKSENWNSHFYTTSLSCSFTWEDAPLPVYDILSRESPTAPTIDGTQYVMIIATSVDLFAVIVDNICYEQEIITMPIVQIKGKYAFVESSSHLTGCAILGDGSICYCLDFSKFPLTSHQKDTQEDLCAF